MTTRTPRSTLAVARYAARKTKPRATYQDSPSRPLQATRTNFIDSQWPFPVSAVRGELVHNVYSQRLARVNRLVPAALGILALILG